MKRLIYLFLSIFPLLVTSCLIEEDEVFEQTPAERMDAFLSEYKTLLESNGDGWLFECYPEANQKYGGYAYVLQFKDGMVTAFFEMASAAVSSTYKMTSDDGPVLSFDTYNENLHFFANPSSDRYQGFQGDYEYNIMGKSEDGTEIYLKGRKSGNRMTFKKFTGVDPASYFAKSAEIASAMASPSYSISVDGKTASCSMAGNVLSYSLVTAEATETAPETVETGSCAFCYTDVGLNFYEPFTIGGTEYEGLLYDPTTETFVSEDGKIVITQVIPPLNQLFIMGNWFIKYSTLGPEGQFYFDYVKQGEDAIGEELQYALLGSMFYPGFGFQFISSGYGGALFFDYALEGDDIVTLQFAMSGAGDGVWYHNNAGFNYALLPFGYSSARTFKLTADDNKNPTQITMTEVDNEEHSMTLFAEEVAYPFDN